MGEKVIIANNVFAQDGVSIYGTPSGSVIGTCPLTDEEIISGTIMSYVKEQRENQYGLPKLHALSKEELIDVIGRVRDNLISAQDKEKFVKKVDNNLADIETECHMLKKDLIDDNKKVEVLFPRGERKGPEYQELNKQIKHTRFLIKGLELKSKKMADFKQKFVTASCNEISNALNACEKILSNLVKWDIKYIPFAGYTAGKKVQKLLTWQWERDFVVQTRCGLLNQYIVDNEEADE